MRPCTSPTRPRSVPLSSAKRCSAAAQIDGLGFLDQRADPEDPRAAVDGAARRRPRPPRGARAAGSRVSIGWRPGGFSVEAGDVEIAIDASSSGCAGSGSRSSTADVDWRALGGQGEALLARRSGAARRSPRAPRSRNAHPPAPAHACRRRAGSRPSARPASSALARLALVAPGQQARLARPAAAARGSSVARCWRARISVGAINAAWRAGLDRVQHGQQRDDGLAAADIALQQAQHAVRRAMSASISAMRRGLRRRSARKGRAASACSRSRRCRRARGPRARRWRARTRAQRQLVGQQLVIGEPLARRRRRARDRRRSAAHARPASAARQAGQPWRRRGRIDPFRQLRGAGRRRRRMALPRSFGVSPAVRRIDRLDRLQRRHLGGRARRSRDGPSAAGRRSARPGR